MIFIEGGGNTSPKIRFVDSSATFAGGDERDLVRFFFRAGKFDDISNCKFFFWFIVEFCVMTSADKSIIVIFCLVVVLT